MEEMHGMSARGTLPHTNLHIIDIAFFFLFLLLQAHRDQTCETGDMPAERRLTPMAVEKTVC